MAELLRKAGLPEPEDSTAPFADGAPAHQLDDAPHRLLACCREAGRLAEAGTLLDHVPRLALGICGAPRAQLVELDAAGSMLVAAHGLSLRSPAEEVLRQVRRALDVSRQGEAHLHSTETGHHLAAIGLPGAAPLVLVVEREPRAGFSPREMRELQILACFCATALARARSESALRISHAVEAALSGAIQDAVIVLDAHGIVRALSGPASTLIGGNKDAIGRRLREIPGLAPLALALGAPDRSPGAVQLFSRKLAMRVRRFETGLTVTLRDNVPGRAPEAGALFQLDDLLGDSPALVRTREKARRVADSELPVLITGETGTGKEILAQALHNASARAGEPFIAVNVSALPRELLESELFGYEAGAFTGASAKGNPGLFEIARNGTLLLDEVGELPLELQPKLLRVLQERAVRRLGGSRARPFSARVIASTNRDLEQDVRDGLFRLDLLHRLRVVHLVLPPLRDRGGDLRLLVAHRLHRMALATGRPAIRISGEVLAALESHRWPGNVRELVNVLESEAGMLPPGKDVIDTIPESISRSLLHVEAPAKHPEARTLAGAERDACLGALQEAGWNVSRAAAILDVAKATLYAKIKRYGLAAPRSSDRR